jgi:hypothetical protein
VSRRPVVVGSWRRRAEGPELASDDPELRPHLGRPWLRDWVERELGLAPPAGPTGIAAVEDDALGQHALIVGTSGFGKSRLATQLAVEQFRNGCSLVFLEPSDLAVVEVLDALRRAEVRPDRVTLAMPGKGRPFAWNPIDAAALGTSGDEAARTFVDALREIWGGEGVRWPDMFRAALLLASAHALTPWHALELLRSAPYRESVLRRDLPPGVVSRTALRETLRYFREEFPAVSRGESVAAVMNKVRESVLSPFLSDMFSSGRESFRLGSLWKEPCVLLVNLHPTAMGDEGGQLLGTLLARHLFAAALREGGRGGTPVVLFLDELPKSQAFLGKTAGDVTTFARKYDLRLVAATQHLYKVNPELREDLLANASVKAFFRLGKRDAEDVAGIIADSEPDAPARVRLRLAERDRRYGTVAWEAAAYSLRDGRGEVFRAREAAWEALRETPKGRLLAGLATFAAVSGLPGPVTAAGVPLAQFLEGLPEEDWELCGPAPLSVRVRFPRPLAKAEGVRDGGRERRWRHRLMNLGKREAVLFTPQSDRAGEILVAHVPDAGGDPGFLEAVLARNGDGTDPEDEEERREVRAGEEAARYVPAPPAPKGASAPKAAPLVEGKKGKAVEPAAVPPGWEDDSIA